jgi:D-amino-acid dehydrogenase
MYDAVVVGGGIVGAAAGYFLADAGAEALLVDRADEGRATAAGAGIVAPATSVGAPESWYDFGLRAAARYPDLDAALRAAGEETGYAPCDLLHVGFEGERDALDRLERGIRGRAARFDAVDPDAVSRLSGEAARERFAPLGSVAGALRYADAARVTGDRFAAALRSVGEARGLTVREGEATGVDVEGGEVAAVRLDGERVETGAAVVAGGAWSAAFAADLGVEIPVDPQRGQIAHLRTEGTDEDRPIVQTFREIYLVPWPDGRIAAGATREDGVGFDPRATVGGVEEVLSQVRRVAPGLDDAELAAVRVGLRPVPADGLPLVGPVPGVGGAYVATGHGATGLQLGPYSGEAVAGMITGAADVSIPDAFRVGRF